MSSLEKNTIELTLAEEQHEEIFQKEIIPDIFCSVKTQKKNRCCYFWWTTRFWKK